MKYRFKFSVPIIIALIIAIALSLFAVVWNAVLLSKIGAPNSDNVKDFIPSLIMIIVGTVFAIFCTELFFSSYYKIADKKLVLRLGFIKITHLISNVKAITLFTKTEKLVAYFKNGKYTVVVISKKDYDAFIKEMEEQNPDLISGTSLPENEE